MKKRVFATLIAATAMIGTNVHAAETTPFNAEDIYVGGGLSSNSASGLDSAMGFQIFAGVPLNVDLGSVNSAVEVGYMDSGKMEACVNVPFFGNVCGGDNATGIWANYVATMPLSGQLYGVGRLGLDFGDDDGLMYGIGVGHGIDDKLDVRGEYVARDNINSLQLNVVYRLR